MKAGGNSKWPPLFMFSNPKPLREMIAEDGSNELEFIENFPHEPIFGPDAPEDEQFDEEMVRKSIYTEIISEKQKAAEEIDKWNLRMLCLQEWFIRCSWINKFLFLNTIAEKTKGTYVLENVLKCIEYINAKDVLESLSRTCSDYDYDRILIDDNRALNEPALNEAMKDDLLWFSKQEPLLQIRIMLKILRLGGGGLIYYFFKNAEQLYKIRLFEPVFSPPTAEEDQETHRSPPKPSFDSKATETGSVIYGLRKASQLTRRNAELLAYKKMRGIYGSNAGMKIEPTEIVDNVQILPLQLNRKILSYLDDRTLLGLKKVGKYWEQMIDELINERNARKIITAKINKLSGGKFDNEARDVEEMREEEKIECQSVQKLKEMINKKLKYAPNEFGKLCEKIMKNFTVKILDSSFFRNRCGDFDAAAGLLACSTPNNMVHFYSVRTGARMNFSLFGFESSVTCMTFHEDRIHIIVGCRDGSLISKDMRNNKTNASFNGHADAVVAIFATSSNLLSGSKDNRIKYFHLWSGLCLLHVNLNPDYSLSTLSLRTSTPLWAIIGTADGGVIGVDLNAKAYTTTVKLHADQINQVVCLDNILITGSDWGNIRVWNLRSLTDSFTKPKPFYNINVESPVTCLTLYKYQLFCGCENGTLKLISLAEGKVLKTIKISSQASILGIKITEDNFCMKLIIWHDKGIEIRSFSLGELSSKKKAIGKDNRESKQKAPTARRRNKTSHAVPVCFGKATLEGNFAIKALHTRIKRPMKETCCTFSLLRQPQDMNGIYCSDIFTDVLNMYSSALEKNFSFKTFPRYNKP